jgi:riboflavin kinase/FMN adenylyltransferase
MGMSQTPPPPSVVTPGNHDGVHAGHRALVAEAIELARGTEPRLRVLALTFHPHPMQLVAPERAPQMITTPGRRAELLRGAGADEVAVCAFDGAFAALSPEAFVTEVLMGKFGARAIVVGDDFRFGHRRAGDVAMLASLGAQHGLTVVELPKIVAHGEVISSSRVRSLLQRGDVGGAAELLTRVHDVTQTVVTGFQRGRTIGVPTANLAPDDALLPSDGVYAVAVRCLDQPALPLQFGTANLGVRPTLGAGRSLEVHIHDFRGDLYGQALRVGFIARLRDEQKFDGIDALRAQIAKDIAASRVVAAACTPELLTWM